MWLGLELASLASYVLAAWRGGDRKAAEAGMKYVLFGGVASALMLFGMSHVYGLTGHLDFAGIGNAIGNGMPLAAVGALCLAGIGVAYKLTLVPFHFYAPDVYQGAPPLGVAAVAVLPKIGATAALVRFLSLAVSPSALPAAPVAHLLAWLAAASALFAAVTAVVQRDAKRILAFSGIGHGAAVLLAVACGPGRDAAAAAGFYLLTYAAANVGAFVCLSVLERERGSSALDSLAGVARQRPWVAGALCIFVFSLAGVPPLAGFLGKWAVLQQALARGLAADGSPALGVAALLFLAASAVSAWAYLLIVRAAVLAPSPRDSAAASKVPAATTAALALCAVATFFGGIWLNGLTALRAWL
jgi:NADH-quinone oxidoreductase subunit N